MDVTENRGACQRHVTIRTTKGLIEKDTRILHRGVGHARASPRAGRPRPLDDRGQPALGHDDGECWIRTNHARANFTTTKPIALQSGSNTCRPGSNACRQGFFPAAPQGRRMGR
jgi:hypothetical protein